MEQFDLAKTVSEDPELQDLLIIAPKVTQEIEKKEVIAQEKQEDPELQELLVIAPQVIAQEQQEQPQQQYEVLDFIF